MPLLHIASGGPDWFQWSVHLDTLLLCAGLLWAYFWVINSLRFRVIDAGRTKRSQQLYFVSGIVAMYLAAGGPLEELADGRLVSAHMAQHLVLMMVVPPLLIAGVPSWAWRALLRQPGVMAIARAITRPLIALILFNAVFFATHLPEAVDLQLQSWQFHLLAHVSQVSAGIVMWWLILSPIEELPRLTYPLQMGYLFLQSLIPSVLAGVFTFANGAVYEAYAVEPRFWGVSIVEDQQISAAIMKIGGTLILWSFILVAFFKWYVAEESAARGPRWSEVEEELQEMGLGR